MGSPRQSWSFLCGGSSGVCNGCEVRRKAGRFWEGMLRVAPEQDVTQTRHSTFWVELLIFSSSTSSTSPTWTSCAQQGSSDGGRTWFPPLSTCQACPEALTLHTLGLRVTPAHISSSPGPFHPSQLTLLWSTHRWCCSLRSWWRRHAPAQPQVHFPSSPSPKVSLLSLRR